MTQETTTPNETTVVPEAQPDKSATNATGKTFTEAEVQELIKKRLAQQSGSERKKALEELGIEDPVGDKELLAAARKRKADEQTAAEKAVEALEKETAKREKAEKDFADFQAATEAKERSAARESAVTKALTAANAKAEKVLKLLRVDYAAELDAVLKDDGTVDEGKVTKLVEKARGSYPEDFGRGGPGSPSNSQGRAVEPGQEARERAARLQEQHTRSRF